MSGSGPHLVVAVAAHGWGHLAQTLPMVAALSRRIPGLRVTVRTGLSPSLVRARFIEAGMPLPNLVHDDTEFGFVMHDALHIDDAASLARYRALFDARALRLQAEREVLRALRADAVLTNIGWLPIAAAASLGLPAFGASSLNWAELLASRPVAPQAAGIIDWMGDAYRCADVLFALEPGLPFERFARRIRVSPIGRVGAVRPTALRVALGAPQGARVMLLAFGGVPLPIAAGDWGMPEGWHALVPGAVPGTGPVHPVDLPGWSFPDLLASCDLLVAKPGYGTFVEAGLLGRDTLVVPRPDWIESAYLVDWLACHARVATIAVSALRQGDFAAAIASLTALPPRPRAQGDGAREIAEAIARRLGVEAPSGCD